MLENTIQLYKLCVSKRAAVGHRDHLVKDDSRFARLSTTPDSFTSMRGDYPTISAKATALNEAQLRSKFLDYLYFPELV